MKKMFIVFLTLALLMQAMTIPAAADYVVGNAQSGVHQIPGDAYVSSFPFEVEVVYRASRYAVDVEYDNLSINVQSAVWDVNNYQYDVTMAGEPSFDVKVINHSDKPIYTRIIPYSMVPGITFEQDAIFQNVVTVPAVPAPIGGVASSATSVTSTIRAVPTVSWEAFVNHVIVNEEIVNGECVIGQIALTVSPN